MAPLLDQHGTPIPSDSIFLLGGHYYRMYRTKQNEWEAISCTKGYLHDIQQEEVATAQLIGPFSVHKDLLVCD
jgi:hypothetical protein